MKIFHCRSPLSHTHHTSLNCMMLIDDFVQVQVEEAIRKWQSNNPDAKFFFRPFKSMKPDAEKPTTADGERSMLFPPLSHNTEKLLLKPL